MRIHKRYKEEHIISIRIRLKQKKAISFCDLKIIVIYESRLYKKKKNFDYIGLSFLKKKIQSYKSYGLLIVVIFKNQITMLQFLF